MGDWKQVGENLVQHVGGTIYLRAKVNGKVIKVSLKTKSLRIAKLRRDDKLASMRTAAMASTSTLHVRTLGDAVTIVADRLLHQPNLKPPTIKYYQAMLKILNDTLPLAIHGRTWTAGEAAKWWVKISGKYAPQRANNALLVCRKVAGVLVEMGLRMDDPTAKLKRMKLPDTEPENVPSLADVQAICKTVRAQGKAHSNEAADYIEFLAFAGCRHGQAQAFEWEHDEGAWLKFPHGVSGTKGAATRRLPISPPLRTILDRIKARIKEATKEDNPMGKIFKIRTPRIALDNACERLEIKHVRIHDLRHFFTTFAIECQVDIPTIARWLGHKDGGKLLLKTYGHLRDQHSLSSAGKLTLPETAG